MLAIIAPPICFYCKEFLSERLILCDKCRLIVNPIATATLMVTPKQLIKVFAVSDYREPLRSFIVGKFWSNQVGSAYLGHLMWRLTNIRNVQFDCIVPIPLHWTRKAWRGFNQAEVIAHVLSEHSGKPLVHLVARIKRTAPQPTLSRDARAHNLEGVFEIDEANIELYRGKHILVVDDLMTTGATLQYAARELLKLKPASITAIVGCRVV